VSGPGSVRGSDGGPGSKEPVSILPDRILSFEVHSMKPEPEIFQAAVARAGCRAEECFFTDDLADNVEAAKRQGMDAVQFESPAQLEEEMDRRGIRWR
jgi:glucose-1-phosphatase